MKLDHAAALETAKFMIANLLPSDHTDLAACYLDLTQQLAELRRLAREYMDANEAVSTEEMNPREWQAYIKAAAALRAAIERSE